MKPLSAPGASRRPAWIAALLGLGLSSSVLAQSAGLRDSPIVKACGSDAHKRCRTVEPGGGRVVACLRSHEAELSAACKAQLPQAAQCQEQIAKLCGDGTRKQQRACVESKHGELAVACGPVATAN